MPKLLHEIVRLVVVLKKFVLFIVLLLAVTPADCSKAASIKLLRELSTPEFSAIAVIGDITGGDANEFLNVVADTKNALVFLSSNGGDAQEGLALAKLIKKLGYATAVIDDFRCMSACALIWIGGSKRYLSKNAVVGFHSVYTSSGVSGGGNAIYGAFYGTLGLSDRAIIYLTSAPPDGFNQVTLDIAPLLDITVRRWEEQTPKTSETQPLSSPQSKPNPSDFFNEKGVDIIGFDLPNGSFKTSDENSCYAACSASSSCMAYTFDTKNHVCYQKIGGRLLLPNSDAISGARASVNTSLKRSSIVIYGKKNVPGFEVRAVFTSSLEECVFECDSESECKAFTWNKKSKICSIKSDHNKLIADRNSVSGLR
jgi:PAN domain